MSKSGRRFGVMSEVILAVAILVGSWTVIQFATNHDEPTTTTMLRGWLVTIGVLQWILLAVTAWQDKRFESYGFVFLVTVIIGVGAMVQYAPVTEEVVFSFFFWLAMGHITSKVINLFYWQLYFPLQRKQIKENLARKLFDLGVAADDAAKRLKATGYDDGFIAEVLQRFGQLRLKQTLSQGQ